MNPMKMHGNRILKYVSLLLLGVGLLFPMIGCKRDKCKRVVCVNGSCVDGTCNCTTGYYGAECNAVINEGLQGAWNLTEDCTAGADNYEVMVEIPGDEMVRIKMVGIWEQPDTLLAVFDPNGTDLSIERTTLGNKEVSAEGTISDDRREITLNYKVYNPGAATAFDVCVATLTKQ